MTPNFERAAPAPRIHQSVCPHCGWGFVHCGPTHGDHPELEALERHLAERHGGAKAAHAPRAG